MSPPPASSALSLIDTCDARVPSLEERHLVYTEYLDVDKSQVGCTPPSLTTPFRLRTHRS